MRTATEIQERYYGWLAMFAFAYSIKAMFGAAVFLFPGAADVLGTARSICGWLAALIFFIGAAIQLTRQTRLLLSLKGPADLRRRGRIRADGFTFDAIRTASFMSLALTGTTLAILADVVPTTSLPAAFYLDLALFVCLASFSIAWFCLDVLVAGRGARGEAGGEAV